MSLTVLVALTAAPLIALTLLAWRRLRSLRRLLAAERTAARLMDASHHRDVQSLRGRLREVRDATAVLAAADFELDQALTYYATTDPTEGGQR